LVGSDLIGGSNEPLLIQLWEVNSLFPDEIAGEIRITIDSLLNAKATKPIEVRITIPVHFWTLTQVVCELDQ